CRDRKAVAVVDAAARNGARNRRQPGVVLKAAEAVGLQRQGSGADPTSMRANGTDTSLITVQLKDSSGVNLTQSHGTVVLTTNAGTLLGSVVDHGDGTYSQTLRAGLSAATATITATLGGQDLTDTAAVSFGANGAPTITAPDTQTVKQNELATFTATASDPENDLPLRFSLVSGPGAITEGGVYTWTPDASTTPGDYEVVIRVTDNLGATRDKTIIITVTERDASLAESTITANPTSIRANGTTTSLITVQLKDSLGVNLTKSHGTVVLSTTKGTLVGTVTDHGNGTYSQTLKSEAASSSVTAVISATLGGQALTRTATVAMDAYGRLEATVKTSTGWAIGGVVVVLTTVGDLELDNRTTDADGLVTFADLPAGAYKLYVPAGAANPPAATANVTVAGNVTTAVELEVTSQATITLTANPEVIVGDGISTSALTATLLYNDARKTPVTGVNVLFEAKDAGTLSADHDDTDSSGNASVTLRAPKLTGTANLEKFVEVFAKDVEKGIFAHVKLKITFQPAILRGVVLDTGLATRTPIKGAKVVIDEDFGTADTRDDFYIEVLTDDDGRYAIKVPRGNWPYKPIITAKMTVGGVLTDVTTVQRGQVNDAGTGQTYNADRTVGGQVFIGTKETGGVPRALQSNELRAAFVGDNKGATIAIDETTGAFTITNATENAEYQVRFRYVYHDPVENKDVELAGVTATIRAVVNADGQVGLQTALIDPFGVVRNTSGQLVSGATVTLRWAETDVARGRILGNPVALPALAGFPPANNAVPQVTPASGEYAWMVFPDSSYYITVTHPNYEPYDSRTAGVANRVIGDSRITNGVIYVGTDIVNFDITLQSPPVVVPVVRPNPPTNLTATPTQSSINLTWTPTPGATSYKVYRSERPSGPFVPLVIGVPTNGYTDTAVTAGQTYYYYVTAYGTGGESNPSNTANATVPQPPTPPVTPPTPPTQPEPPADLKVTPGDKQVDLTWTPSAGAT
ncbi:MAG TPA: invasin domain 3-containing protein, partial [Symbiobacteriaceae bacterium]|nr:invasin domain 3-containing protein [Symbiobacteriaceae bacterium]